MEEGTQLFPIQIFTIIFCVAVVIVLFGGCVCLVRFERDLRHNIESQKVFPKSHSLFTNINQESLPA